MPITQSAKKALRQSVRRHRQNLKRKGAFTDAAKIVKKMALSGKTSDTKEALSRLYAALDKAAKAHAIAKNKASRLKSRLTKLLAKQPSAK
ncbi:MAG: 30S ribosomal protein S20 [Candidatus Sungiibacteriota bacterium]